MDEQSPKMGTSTLAYRTEALRADVEKEKIETDGNLKKAEIDAEVEKARILANAEIEKARIAASVTLTETKESSTTTRLRTAMVYAAPLLALFVLFAAVAWGRGLNLAILGLTASTFGNTPAPDPVVVPPPVVAPPRSVDTDAQ